MKSYNSLVCFCVILSILSVSVIGRSGDVKKVKLINKPATAVKYKLLKKQYLNYNRKTNINNIPNDGLIQIWTYTKGLYYIRIYTKDNNVCGTQLVVEKPTSLNRNTITLPPRRRQTTTKKPTPSNNVNYDYVADFSKITCGPKPTATTPKPPIQNKVINTALVKVGDEFKITCVSRAPIIQNFPYDNQSIIYPPCPSVSDIPPNTYKCTFIFKIWEDFDMNTTLTSTCVRTSPVEPKANPPLNTELDIIQYTSDKLVYYTCSHPEGNTKYVNVTLIRNNRLMILPDFRLNMSFTGEDNGSILSCFVYKTEDTTVTRYFKNKTMLIYQENNGNTDNKDWLIGVGAGAVSITVIIIISLAIRKYNKKTKLPITSESEPKETPNPSPDRALYANLDVATTEKCKQNTPVEESPYATVMSPDSVVYAQLDLQNGNREPDNIESPYAEVFVSNTRGEWIKR